MFNKPDRFVRGFGPVKESPLSQDPTGKQFNLHEQISKKRAEHRRFLFDSEQARNFDVTSVDRAREGVKEIVLDAINKAKSKSLEIREEARKEGFVEGYAKGYQKGVEDAKNEYAPFLKTLQDTLADLSGFRKKMYAKVEREMMEMVLDLAKKVIHNELLTREDAIKETIRFAVESVLDREKMTIRINPADKLHAESFRPELQQLFSEIKNVSFEAHPSVEKGGCIIESNFGSVDARLDKLGEQIDKILNLAPPPLENPDPRPPA